MSIGRYNYLDKIKQPSDIKSLSFEELDILCEEIREELIEVVSKNGGHLASNLGVVELSVALHNVFDSPKDMIVFDVGHQCYTHKLLTGRRESFHTIRKQGGISGFPKPSESEHDAFATGHSSTSISAAFGLAAAKQLLGEEGHVIAVIGDGALTGGLAYEGLNNAGKGKGRLVVVLNDNKMSISKNVGSMASYLAEIRSRPIYFMIKDTVDRLLRRIPIVGRYIRKALIKSKSLLKNSLYNSNLFEEMGFEYLGPVDGHDVKKLSRLFNRAKQIDKPSFIHVLTVKGKGYHFAEQQPHNFHGVMPFNKRTGDPDAQTGKNYSSFFGRYLAYLASKDERIVAITAAMTTGTGLCRFAKRYGDRFFDVGIAEGHAVTFSAGMAKKGLIPVFAVYSSFLQRSYDQIIHDAALTNQHIILAIDRAGIVGEDGETHQGLFDISFLSGIPNTTIFAPSSYRELALCLNRAVNEQAGVVALRYPKGREADVGKEYRTREYKDYLYFNDSGQSDCLIITYGRLFEQAVRAREHLKEKGIVADILKPVKTIPLNSDIAKIASGYKRVFFYEESIRQTSVGSLLGMQLCGLGFGGKYVHRAIDNPFISQGSYAQIISELGLDCESMIRDIQEADR